MIASAQGVDNILKANYSANTYDENYVWIEQHKFVYSVLINNMRTDKGKEIVLAGDGDPPAKHTILQNLLTHWKKST